MRKNYLKATALVICLTLVVGIIGGCGESNSSQQTTSSENSTAATTAKTTATGLDISKKVSLVFWMLGDAAKDLSLISDEVNKLAEKDLNCNVKFNFTTWTDWSQKYKLLLTSGEKVDLIYTAEWTDYQRYANSGAFLALDDILPKAAPTLYSFVPKESWDAVKVRGKIYTIPATYKEYVYDGFEYREDLRKKYNLPEINSLETIEKYLDAIKTNEKGMMPLAETVADDQFSTIISMTSELLHPWLDRNLPKYGLTAMNDKPADLIPYWGTAEHKADLEISKRWADKGFWSRSILSSKEDAAQLFRNGKIGAKVSGINPNKFADDVSNIKSNHPEWEVGYFPYSSVSKVIHPTHAIHNGFAVAKSSENPERAVAFYEKMVTDKTYNQLTEYGIEGKHYTVENGYYKMVGDQTSNGFGREGMQGWSWRNPEYMLFTPDYDPVKKLFSEFDKYATPDVFSGFAEDYTTYQTERTALIQVMDKYLQPLQAGLVKDVDASLKEFMEKAKAAGLDKIQAEYTKQYKAYCEAQGIK